MAETAARYNLTPDEWRAESVMSRYEMLARCRAEDTMKAWTSMDRKERNRAIFAWREAKAEEKEQDGSES